MEVRSGVSKKKNSAAQNKIRSIQLYVDRSKDRSIEITGKKKVD